MRPTLEELRKALETLQRAEALDGQDPEKPMTIREALDVVFRASPQQLYEAGFEYAEPPEKEER